MRKWIFYVVGAFLLLLGACADGGTVDPNAFAANYSSANNDPKINVPTSSSSAEKGRPAVDSGVANSGSSVQITSSADVIVPDSLTPDVSVETEVVINRYFAFSGKSEKSYTVLEDAGNSNSVSVVNTAVYEAEKGAVSYCADEDKNYTLKIRLVPDKEVKKLLTLGNLGNGCEPVFNAFKAACELKSMAELQLIQACDSNGNLEVFCSYTDETGNFDLLLHEYMQEVENGCNSEYLDASVYLQGEW